MWRAELAERELNQIAPVNSERFSWLLMFALLRLEDASVPTTQLVGKVHLAYLQISVFKLVGLICPSDLLEGVHELATALFP